MKFDSSKLKPEHKWTVIAVIYLMIMYFVSGVQGMGEGRIYFWAYVGFFGFLSLFLALMQGISKHGWWKHENKEDE